MSSDPQLAFRALADPTRRDILHVLANGGLTIGQITEHFDVTRPAIKKHLTILEQGNMIDVTPRGRERINSLKPQGLRPVNDWLSVFDQFWDNRLHDLKTTIVKELN